MIRYTHRLAARCLLLTAVAFSSLAGAQDAPDAPQDDRQSDRDALIALAGLYEQAVSAGDPATLQPYLADGFTAVMVTNDDVNSFDDLAAYWDRIAGMLGPNGHYDVTPAWEPATFHGSVAIAHGTTADVAVAHGKTFEFTSRWTAVLVHTNDDTHPWRLLRLHASMDPVDNAFVTARTNATRWVAAAVGAAAGLALGATLTLLLTTRRARRANA